MLLQLKQLCLTRDDLSVFIILSKNIQQYAYICFFPALVIIAWDPAKVGYTFGYLGRKKMISVGGKKKSERNFFLPM